MNEEIITNVKECNIFHEGIMDGRKQAFKEFEQLIDKIECSAQDNAIWFKRRIKQKLKEKEEVEKK